MNHSAPKKRCTSKLMLPSERQYLSGGARKTVVKGPLKGCHEVDNLFVVERAKLEQEHYADPVHRIDPEMCVLDTIPLCGGCLHSFQFIGRSGFRIATGHRKA